MKVKSVTHLLFQGSSEKKSAYHKIESEVKKAIAQISWPPNSKNFTIYPQSGKKRGEGNGVKPIKISFVKSLISRGWKEEFSVELIKGKRFGKFDTYKDSPPIRTVLEWETGNISSSHRSMNKMILALKKGKIDACFLILPSRNLYQYLTDRVGNFQDILLSINSAIASYVLYPEAPSLLIKEGWGVMSIVFLVISITWIHL